MNCDNLDGVVVGGAIGIVGTLLGGVLTYHLGLRADRIKRERDREDERTAARDASEAEKRIRTVQG